MCTMRRLRVTSLPESRWSTGAMRIVVSAKHSSQLRDRNDWTHKCLDLPVEPITDNFATFWTAKLYAF